MSRKRSKLTKKQIKHIIIGCSVTAAAVIGVLLIIFLPTIKANSELKEIFDDIKAMKDPVIIVTDMKVDNTFSDARGEVIIDDTSSTKFLINDILELSDDLDYYGKEPADAWGMRVRVYDKERSADLYFAYGKMYYVKNDKRYVFVPDTPEAEAAYKILYQSFSAFVR